MILIRSILVLHWIRYYPTNITWPRLLKIRNNLLSKLASSSWGANAVTLHSSALAFCYSVGERSTSSHTDLVDVQLNNTMHLITGTLRHTQLQWLPVLANIAPSKLRRKATTDVLIEKIKLHRDWPVHNDVFAHVLDRLPSSKPLWLDLTTSDITRSSADADNRLDAFISGQSSPCHKWWHTYLTTYGTWHWVDTR